MPSDASVSAGATAEGREPGVPGSPWSTLPWYETGVGLGVVGFDVVLTIALALGTAGLYRGVIPTFSTGAVGVPLSIYAFCLLGALGYVFTTLVERFDSETERVLRYNLRLPAALPLGAGLHVLSGIILGDAASEVLVHGLVFLSGLYVNLAYKRLGALARRLLPKKQTEDSRSGTASTDTPDDGSTPDAAPSSNAESGPGDREPVSVSRATPDDDSQSTTGTSTSSDSDERKSPTDSPSSPQ